MTEIRWWHDLLYQSSSLSVIRKETWRCLYGQSDTWDTCGNPSSIRAPARSSAAAPSAPEKWAQHTRGVTPSSTKFAPLPSCDKTNSIKTIKAAGSDVLSAALLFAWFGRTVSTMFGADAFSFPLSPKSSAPLYCGEGRYNLFNESTCCRRQNKWLLYVDTCAWFFPVL